MACSDDISNICVDPIKATCVDYEGALGANTKITEDCVNQNDVNEDLYAITDEIIENIDASNLGNLCITYPVGTITPKSALEQHEIEICDLQTRVTALENQNFADLDITGFGLNFSCLVDPCGAPITTLGQLLQIMINKDCE
jgi:hypothetical protein